MRDENSFDLTKVERVRLECGECPRAIEVPVVVFLSQNWTGILLGLCPDHCGDKKLAMASRELTRLSGFFLVLAEMAVSEEALPGIPFNIRLVTETH